MTPQRVAVVGAGVMGSEIAQVMAAAGLSVVLRDVTPEFAERGLEHVRDIGARRVARGRMTEDEAAAILGRISPSTDDADLATCDLAIEVVTEVLDVKRSVFRALDAALPPHAVLASNTSGLSISALARETGRPGRVVGMHFFNPASVMRLVEVIQGDQTSAETLETARELSRALGKTPVLVRECPGFLVNRILIRAMVEAYRVASERGAAIGASDAATAEGGPAPMGPFALGDLIGLDTMDHIQRDLQAAYGERFADGGRLAALVAEGRLGRKSGSGFYDGTPAAGEADDAGRAVAERYYLGALHEACLCLQEEIAALPDIDTAMRLGAGWSEGPLAWADATGLPGLAERLAALAVEAGPRFSVPEALAARIASGEGFMAPAA
jgi:3-hydroxyacyl-CoA dehydrogenase